MIDGGGYRAVLDGAYMGEGAGGMTARRAQARAGRPAHGRRGRGPAPRDRHRGLDRRRVSAQTSRVAAVEQRRDQEVAADLAAAEAALTAARTSSTTQSTVARTLEDVLRAGPAAGVWSRRAGDHLPASGEARRRARPASWSGAASYPTSRRTGVWRASRPPCCWRALGRHPALHARTGGGIRVHRHRGDRAEPERGARRPAHAHAERGHLTTGGRAPHEAEARDAPRAAIPTPCPRDRRAHPDRWDWVDAGRQCPLRDARRPAQPDDRCRRSRTRTVTGSRSGWTSSNERCPTSWRSRGARSSSGSVETYQWSRPAPSPIPAMTS